MDKLAQELKALGVDAYTVTDKSRQFQFMKGLEAWAERNPSFFREAIGDVANYISDAAQILRAQVVLQNTWNWATSGFTELELVQTSFWASIRYLAPNIKIGPKEIFRIFMPGS